jgi:hypothetical protein
MDSTTHNRIDVRQILDPANVFGTGLILYCLAMRNADPPEALVSVSIESLFSYVLISHKISGSEMLRPTRRTTYLQQDLTVTS